MMANEDFIMLKFGRLKSWSLTNSPKTESLIDEYSKLPENEDGEGETFKQKEALCKVIDSFDGSINIWWGSEENITKQRAREYIMNYRE